MAATPAELVSKLDGTDPNDIVRRFAANPAYRAATQEELTTEEDPYRRPVRPDDLAWLDYSTPMPADKTLLLSWLLGHRMLRNVYDTDLLHLPPGPSAAADRDGGEFYSLENRVLGALAGPILERHLFTYLEEDREPLAVPELGPLKAHLRAYREERSAIRDDAFAIALTRRDRREAATFVLLQLSAYLPAAYDAVGRAALGEYTLAHPTLRGTLLADYADWSDRASDYAGLLGAAGLKPGTAAYWQLFLGTSLARGNHLHHLSRTREHAFRFLGAWVHKRIDDAVTANRYAALSEEAFGHRTRLFDQAAAFDEGRLDVLLEPLIARFGTRVVEEFHAGFEDARRLAELWNRDLSEQLAWADEIPAYMDRAERIQQHITDEHIDVDLDTFVESCEETSTTHVHDEHRW
ncbi:hypothetical protein [Actinoallomurus acaciae]|uniref:Uncharacterized protein n=1 Tax=Actinoallomurus acaciae TaxID=502577 RepID=A0ABV5YCA6_9ACTN